MYNECADMSIEDANSLTLGNHANNIKKKYKVVKDGKFKLLYPHNSKLFIYTRENKKHIMLVIASFSKKNTNNVLKNKLNENLDNGGNGGDVVDKLF